MTKRDLRDALKANHDVCEEFCLYELLECESEDDFNENKMWTIDSIEYEINALRKIKNALRELTYEEVTE